MTDLKRLNGGLKLIKRIISTSKQANQPWSNDKQLEMLKKHRKNKLRRLPK